MSLSLMSTAFADNVTMPEAVESAVLSNPEIGAMFHDFQSDLEGQKVGRGALLPEVNLSGWTGREWRSKMDDGRSSNWNRNGYELSLRQLLFDGFSTINDVRQLGFEKLSSYYTLKSTVDGLAQEATEAYLDVQRFREQVELAENNYQMHKDIFGQISERSESGVGRGVDQTQAKARMALAQTNLMTDNGNLNDVTQRYQRIVGKTPAQTYAARDVRDYTCRNVQQELAVAWNNVERLRNQMPYLQEHERDIAQVRVAYLQQFKIGQRTLLDLLDTETELFDARQALTNGIFDLRIAEYRWLSLSHKLLPSLGLADPYADQPDEATKLEFPDEILQACVSPLPNTSNLQAVDVNYKSGMQPPVLKPAGTNSNTSNWN